MYTYVCTYLYTYLFMVALTTLSPRQKAYNEMKELTTDGRKGSGCGLF